MTRKRGSLEREKKTLLAMLTIYCHKHHQTSGEELCSQCSALYQYAEQRLSKCPFGADKGPCAECEVHCYKPQMRKQIQDVMRYSGPRMLSRHPVAALSHLLSKRKHKSNRSK